MKDRRIVREGVGWAGVVEEQLLLKYDGKKNVEELFKGSTPSKIWFKNKANMIDFIFYNSMTYRRFFFLALALLLLVLPAQTQEGNEFEDPEFVKILNNYFGCKTWDEGVCIECSENYYFNNNGVCC